MLPSITLASAQVDSLELESVSIPSDGVLKAEADMVFRGTPMYGEWTLHPVLVKQMWARYGQAAVDLFASR